MKILILSHAFAPNLGGIETVTELLASEFSRRGHEVRVVTRTESPEPDRYPFTVIRRPSPLQLLKSAFWCDVFFQNGVSLRTAWALLLVRRPWVTTHQTWISRADRRISWRDRLKRSLLRLATNVSISREVAKDIGVSSTIIPNPYRDQFFREIPGFGRDRDLVFVGRLVSDKGVDLLIRALAILKSRNATPNLTVVGSGPELRALTLLTEELGLAGRVEFAGPRSGQSLVETLNRHRILVVPSRWFEPFGIVALEGAACGCVVIGSSQGGLSDAIGPCGLTFPNGDVEALSRAIGQALTDSDATAKLRAEAPAHLRRHSVAAITDAYLQLFDQILQKRGLNSVLGK